VIFFGGLQRNPFYFDANPVSNGISHLYLPLSLAPAAFWTHARSDGGDIRVYKQDGTQVARQIAGLDPVSKTGALWIKKDGGTAFRVKYGNAAWTEPAANSTYGSQNAWESALKLVMHCNDFEDSTSNAQSVSHSAGVTAGSAGKIGGAFVDSVSSDYVAVAHNSSLVFANISVVLWINWTSTTGGRIVNKAYVNGGLTWFVVNSSGNLSAGNPNVGLVATTSTASSGSWHQIGFTFDSSGNITHYIDGSPAGSGTIAFTPSEIPATEMRLFNRDDGTRPLIASISGPRVYNRILSGTEVSDMYANQNSPATFWTIGSEQQG
jgi:hypothetical protein